MSKQTILEALKVKGAETGIYGDASSDTFLLVQEVAELICAAIEERFQAERERTEKENLETINVLVALQDLADNATKSLLALEARVNTLTAHTDPSLGLLSDKTSPL